jgi:DNA modification methylase
MQFDFSEKPYQLFTGLSEQVLPAFPDECIDLTVTSPPYDNLREYKGFSFDFETIAQQLFRVTKRCGVVVWVVGDATVNGSETGTSFRQALYFKEVGFSLYDTMIYQKIGCPSPQKPEIRYIHSFEYMFVFCKGKKPNTVTLQLKPNINLKATIQKKSKVQRNGNYLRGDFTNRTHSSFPNVWLIDARNGVREASGFHPAAFPETIADRHIKTWTNQGDTVLDCFLGSGTTGKMAVVNKRNFVGVECSSEYMEIAEARIKRANLEPCDIPVKLVDKPMPLFEETL